MDPRLPEGRQLERFFNLDPQQVTTDNEEELSAIREALTFLNKDENVQNYPDFAKKVFARLKTYSFSSDGLGQELNKTLNKVSNLFFSSSDSSIPATDTSAALNKLINNSRSAEYGPDELLDDFEEIVKSGLNERQINTILLEISKLDVFRGLIPSCIYKLKVSDQDILLQVVKECLKTPEGASAVAEKIGAFRIENEETRLQIAKECMKTPDNLWKVADNIRSYKINNEETRLAIAEECMTTIRGARAVARNIRNFEINNEDARIAIANELLKTPEGASAVIKNIKAFQIESENTRIQIAKECLKIPKNAGAVARKIDAFDITSKEIIDEIAEECLKTPEGTVGVAENIKGFQIDDKVTIKAIINACLDTSEGTKAVAENIESYKIESEDARIEIAKKCLKTDKGASAVAENIKAFHIDNEDARIEIANKCAKLSNSAGRVARNIQAFQISSEDARIQIAKECAKTPQGALTVAQYIRKFEINNEEARFQIAKMCANSPVGFMVVQNIKTFQINNEKALIEIAKECLKTPTGAEKVAQNILLFKITDQKALVQIAKKCAIISPKTTIKFIDDFKILNSQTLTYSPLSNKDRLRIFSLAYANRGAGLSNINNFDLRGAVPEKLRLALADATPEKRVKLLSDFAASKKINLANTFKSLNEKNVKENPVLQNEILDQLTALLLFNESLSLEEQEWIKKWGLMDATLSLKNGSVRKKVMAKVFDIVDEKGYQTDFEKLSTVSVPSKSGRPKIIKISKEFYLKNLVLTLLKPEIDDSNLRKYADRLNIGGVRNDALKMNHLLEGLCDLEDTKTDVKEAIPSILERLVPENSTDKQLVSNSIAMQGLLHLEGAALLKNDPTTLFTPLLLKRLQEIVPIGDVEDFETKYANTLAKFRQFPLISTYAGKLNTVPQKGKLLKMYALFLESTLNNSFLETRQSLENNPHLNFLNKQSPETLKLWHAFSSSKDVEELLGGIAVKASTPLSTDYREELKEKLAVHKHLPPDKIQHLLACLNDSTKEDEMRNKLQKEEKDPYAKVQLLCLDLLRGENIQTTLNALSNQLSEIGSPAENFQNDVKGFLTLLTQSQNPVKENPYKGLQLLFTNDPNDYFLCGTEVIGSCQSITADIGTNKCLLSYLLDGKNRLVVIKDPNGKIVNRSVIRLLWDDTQKQPVLFQEKAYKAQNDLQLDNLLYEQAKVLAAELNVPYANAEEHYENPLLSLGGPVPYEYSDAAAGVQQDGIYTIKKF